ncbi:MAG: hypothetical protein H6728_10455 [Myxococcales bacterium]|nr:hypothetical protein [Myxococcales bacterium]MCB9643479.1 hypothetical protein [Myxococcales bacterium]
MEELIYLLQVSSKAEVQSKVAGLLLLDSAPKYVRVATLAPLSNYGYTPDATGAILAVHDNGIVFGDEKNATIPRAFVPWQNIAYLADGEALAKQNQGG